MSNSEDEYESASEEHEANVDSLTETLKGVELSGASEAEHAFLQEQLEGIECPFTWNLHKLIESRNIIKEVQNKIRELTEDSVDFDHFKWNHFTLNLLLSYLLANSGDYAEATKSVNLCVKLLEDLEEENCREPLFAKIKDALWHVTLASLVYIYFKSNFKDGECETEAPAKNILDKIPKVSQMTDIQKAGLYGIKTHMLMQYGHDGNLLALETAKMARDLDPEMAEWWFLVGKAMGRIRRVVERIECVEKEEIKTLEKAVELQDSTSYIVFLAQTYRECSLRAFKKFKNEVDLKTHNLGKYIDSMNEKALNLYMQALDKRKNCPRTKSRCAAGLLRLPGRFRRAQLAEKILMESLELAPENAYAHHVAGLLYYSYPYKDMNKALYHYEKADAIGNYGASMDVIRTRSELDPTYDPYPDYMKCFDKYKQEVHQINLNIELGSYFLFKKRNLIKAIEYYTTVIKKDKISSLKTNFVAFLLLDGPINLLKILVDEVRLALQEGTSLSKEDKIVLRKFIIDVSMIASEIMQTEPQKNQIENIIANSKSKIAYNAQQRQDPFSRPESGFRRGSNPRGGNSRGRFNSDRKFQDSNEPRESYQQNYRNESGSRRSRSGYRGGLRSRNNPHEQNWRTEQRPESDVADNSQENQNDNRDRLRNRCWRTESSREEAKPEEETYRFPVRNK